MVAPPRLVNRSGGRWRSGWVTPTWQDCASRPRSGGDPRTNRRTASRCGRRSALCFIAPGVSWRISWIGSRSKTTGHRRRRRYWSARWPLANDAGRLDRRPARTSGLSTSRPGGGKALGRAAPGRTKDQGPRTKDQGRKGLPASFPFGPWYFVLCTSWGEPETAFPPGCGRPTAQAAQRRPDARGIRLDLGPGSTPKLPDGAAVGKRQSPPGRRGNVVAAVGAEG